jgi:predicted RNA methylase
VNEPTTKAPDKTEQTADEVQRYWNEIAPDFDAIYTGEKSGVARALDYIFRRDMQQRFEWAIEKGGDIAGKTACDIGCGTGRLAVEYASRGATRVVGIDVAPNMLDLARRVVEDAGIEDRCEFVEADVLDWSPGETFDITLAIGLWDYIPDPVPRLRAIRQITDDRFLSTWPRYWTWRHPVRKARLALAGCPVFFFRRGDVERHFADAGFRVESIDVVGKLFCVDARPA